MKKLEEFKIIDVHAHVFPEKIALRAAGNIRDYYSLPMEGDGTLNTLLALSQGVNIVTTVISSAATKGTQVEIANEFIHEKTLLRPGRLVGLGTTHADYEGFDEEVERIIDFDLRGLKLHTDFQNFPIDDPRMDTAYSICEEKSLPVLFHTGDENSDLSSALRLSRVMARHPDLIIIAAHMGGYKRKKEAQEYLVGKNLYFDTSEWHNMMSKEECADMIRSHGVDKVVFGSDYPLNNPCKCAKAFFECPLTDEEKQKVFYDNAARLFKIK